MPKNKSVSGAFLEGLASPYCLKLMALHFILQIQAENKDEMPFISVTDIKLIFAKKLANKIDEEQGLLIALKLRHKKRKYDIDKRCKVPK